MREIEFRGKRIDNGEWVYGSLVQNEYWTEIWVYHSKEGQENFLNVDKRTVGQYTGVKDSNGVKIYEGDIIKCFSPDGDDYLSHVRYEDGAFIIDVRNSDYDCTAIGWALASDLDGVEVVGNIHDNLELIKGK